MTLTNKIPIDGIRGMGHKLNHGKQRSPDNYSLNTPSEGNYAMIAPRYTAKPLNITSFADATVIQLKEGQKGIKYQSTETREVNGTLVTVPAWPHTKDAKGVIHHQRLNPSHNTVSIFFKKDIPLKEGMTEGEVYRLVNEAFADVLAMNTGLDFSSWSTKEMGGERATLKQALSKQAEENKALMERLAKMEALLAKSGLL